MSKIADKFSDLIVRMISGAIIAVIGLGAVWIGGIFFLLLVALLCGILVWELTRMIGSSAKSGLCISVIACVCFLISRTLPAGFGLPFVLIPAIAVIGMVERNRSLCMVFVSLIMMASFGLSHLRDDFGFIWMLWLALVVIATDVFGYFAGRFLGGPKFFPRVSPKKTWSGTVAGWMAAAIVGICFMNISGVGAGIIGISVAVSMAAQMGDIAESAVKRKMGVKDSSHLIPGHGGFFDRFDGMLGAGLFMLLIEQAVNFPPAAI